MVIPVAFRCQIIVGSKEPRKRKRVLTGEKFDKKTIRIKKKEQQTNSLLHLVISTQIINSAGDTIVFQLLKEAIMLNTVKCL